MDKIFIHALKTEAIIGIFDWERQVKQTVIVDIEISADIRKAALSDSIDDTLNYKRVAKRVLAFVEESKFHLVETLAEHIAMLMLEEFGIAWVRISLSKPGAIRSSRDVGVVLERDRDRSRARGARTCRRRSQARSPNLTRRRAHHRPHRIDFSMRHSSRPGAKSRRWPRARRWLWPRRRRRVSLRRAPWLSPSFARACAPTA